MFIVFFVCVFFFSDIREFIYIGTKFPGGLQIYSVDKNSRSLDRQWASPQRRRCDIENSSATGKCVPAALCS